VRLIRPKRYLDNDEDSCPSGQEARIAERIGGKRVSGSGASFYSKGDVRDVQINGIDFLIEAKQTKHSSISVKWEWLKKITDEAQAKQCEPALSIEIKGGEDDPRVDRDWIMCPMRVWEKLNGR
jgi:hypothetical protein